jgi:hypothetical protein
MRLKRSTLVGLCLVGVCLVGVFAVTSAVAQTVVPRWYVKETGSLVSYSEQSGLIELQSPETLQSQGELLVLTTRQLEKRPSLSNCLGKDRASISNPAESSLPGTGEMEEFEVVCEKGTGSYNAGQPAPCFVGEGFELKGLNLNWPFTLESVTGTHGPLYYANFTGVDIEVDCLKAKTQATYTGSLRAQVTVGRLKFLGPASGELTDISTGEHFALKGSDFIEPVKYKDVRAVNKTVAAASASAVRRGSVASGQDVSVAGGGGRYVAGVLSSLIWGIFG